MYIFFPMYRLLQLRLSCVTTIDNYSYRYQFLKKNKLRTVYLQNTKKYRTYFENLHNYNSIDGTVRTTKNKKEELKPDVHG